MPQPAGFPVQRCKQVPVFMGFGGGCAVGVRLLGERHEARAILLPPRPERPDGRGKRRGFTAVDRRMAAARKAFAVKRELVSALGGEADSRQGRTPSARDPGRRMAR